MFLIRLLFGLLSSLITGFGISLLWGWYVVPLGVPPISIVTAFGLSFLANIFKGVKTRYKGHEIDEMWTISSSLAYPGVSFAAGWILHFFL